MLLFNQELIKKALTLPLSYSQKEGCDILPSERGCTHPKALSGNGGNVWVLPRGKKRVGTSFKKKRSVVRRAGEKIDVGSSTTLAVANILQPDVCVHQEAG